jgi:hypothetical protein
MLIVWWWMLCKNIFHRHFIWAVAVPLPSSLHCNFEQFIHHIFTGFDSSKLHFKECFCRILLKFSLILFPDRFLDYQYLSLICSPALSTDIERFISISLSHVLGFFNSSSYMDKYLQIMFSVFCANTLHISLDSSLLLYWYQLLPVNIFRAENFLHPGPTDRCSPEILVTEY